MSKPDMGPSCEHELEVNLLRDNELRGTNCPTAPKQVSVHLCFHLLTPTAFAFQINGVHLPLQAAARFLVGHGTSS